MLVNVRVGGPPNRPGVLRGMAVAALAAVALLGIPSGGVEAQETGQISGVVTDPAGAPLSDVQVYVVGLQIGGLTRANGRYVVLNVPTGTHTLRAERIGLGSTDQEITVAAGATLTVDFQMDQQALGLDEIVVTGAAGAARRREIGNSITQLNVADVPDNPTNVSDLLQGSAPGIELTGGGGQLGQGKQIRLRGNSSVSMTNQPIVYIDGVRMMDGAFPRVRSIAVSPQGRGAQITASPLDNINPNDIERIEVIKGSAATTLYGTEASAGVIQVFTKRGSQGAPVWTAETQQGTGWAKKYGVNGVDYMHMEHFLRGSWLGGGYEGGEFSRECVVDSSLDDPSSPAYDETTQNSRWQGVNSSADGACRYPGAQWYQNYNLSVRGGSETLQYFLSGGYQDDVGMLPLDTQQKYNLQANFTMSPVDNMQIQWSTALNSQQITSTPSGNNLSGIELQMMRQERNYFPGDGDPREVAQALDYDFSLALEGITTGLTVSYNPIANLTNRFTVGYDYRQQEARNLMPIGFWEFPEGSITTDVFQKRLLTFDYVGNYQFDLSNALRTNFSWGGQAIGNDLRQLTAGGNNFPGAVEPTVSSAAITISAETRERVWNAGFFLQNILDISDKYFITTGVRVDGNSAFGSGFGLQVYPKVSGVWIMSDEGFWPESFGTLKLRSAFGTSGRAPGTFDAVRTWDPVGYVGSPAFHPLNRGNSDLGPEVTQEFEVGFDAAWLDDRIDATFTYYRQTTKDALMSVSAIPSLGFSSSQLENVGELANNGMELQINAAAIEGAVWGLDLGLGISTSKTEVLDLGGNEPFNALSGRIAVGQPVPAAWDDRRVANPDEISDSWEYIDEDNDGIPDEQYVGPKFPTHFITPSLTLRVPGNISLSARGEYRGGNFVEVNPMPIDRSVRSPLCYPYYVDPNTSNELKADGVPSIWRERCTPGGADDYWFDADYFKLRSVSATVPVDFAFPESVSGAMLTLTLANAFDWYREIPWYDLELNSDAGSGADGEGIGNASERTPAPATFRISLRVTF